jgi:hypothetical protein
VTLNLAQTRRYARQIALPEIGGEGQQRLLDATVALVGDDLATRTAAEYLAAAGVGRLRAVPATTTGEGWKAALRGAGVVVCSGGTRDPRLAQACAEVGVALVDCAGNEQAVELASSSGRTPPAPPPQGASAVLAGALAATEALWILATAAGPPTARRLRLPLDGGEPSREEAP